MTSLTLHRDGQGNDLLSGFPDGKTRHVRAGNLTFCVEVIDEFGAPVSGIEFLVPKEELKRFTPEQLSQMYGSLVFCVVQTSPKISEVTL